MLSNLKAGNNAVVTEIVAGNELIKRLAAMGIVSGTSISVVSNTGRGPILVELDGKRLAIGQGMATKIGVEKI